MISDSDKETQDASEDVQDTSLLRTSLYYGHLSITDTFVLRTPLYYGDLSISDSPPSLGRIPMELCYYII